MSNNAARSATKSILLSTEFEDFLFKLGVMDPKAGLLSSHGGINDIQRRRPVLSGTCQASAKLGPPYQAGTTLRRGSLRVSGVYASADEHIH